MTDVAGTTDPKPDDTKGGTPEAGKDDSGQVTVSAQFKKEALESWKPAAEERNQLRQQLAQAQEQLARLAYGGQAATDPRVAERAQLLDQAQYDPVAKKLIQLEDATILAQAETWLQTSMAKHEVPKVKQDAVAAIVRARGYQVSIQDALNEVTDPETKMLAQTVEELRKENERLKSATRNGASPAAAIPANSDAGEGRTTGEIERSEYVATLNAARAPGATAEQKQRALDLMQAVGSNKTRFKD